MKIYKIFFLNISLCFLFLLCILFFLSISNPSIAFALSEPQMININKVPGPSYTQTYLTPLGSTLFFVTNDGIHGNELWKSDSTEDGTVMVKDIYIGSSSSSPSYLTVMGDHIYFTATNGTDGSELWKSDGTEAGTVMVKDINPGASWSSPNYLTIMGGYLYFSANTSYGVELWKSDGTEAGTVLVKDIYVGFVSSSPNYLTAVGSLIYFGARTSANGTELWKSDGTEVGTVLVKDIYSGNSHSFPSNLLSIGSTLYFTATNGTNGVELWRSDGSGAGTVLVKDIYTGPLNSSNPNYFAIIGSTMFFKAYNSTYGYELWKSDGTEAGTVLVKDIIGGITSSSPSYLTVLENNIYFNASDGINGTELWKSDGSESGTIMIKDIYPGSSGSSPMYLIGMGDFIYFSANNGTNGTELWRSDGTEALTTMVEDIYLGNSSSNPKQFNTISNTLYFQATNENNGTELWKSDGTDNNTLIVKDIYIGSAGSSPNYFTSSSSAMYFAANDGTNGEELWKTDGTEVGTVMVKDINIGNGGSSPSSLTTIDDILYFRAAASPYGNELWRSDGTEEGTKPVKDIYPGPGSSNIFLLTPLGNTLYFIGSNGVSGYELWKSDGTEAGTVLVKDISTEGSMCSTCEFKGMGNILYFRANDGTYGEELWRSDGTENGTFMIKDIKSGYESSIPSNFVTIGDTLYFITENNNLWKSDGTEKGTTLVGSLSLYGLFPFWDNLYFSNTDQTYGNELWKSDGTFEGSSLVKDIYIGQNSGGPLSNFATIGTNLFFGANNETNGVELWKSDGTEEGTTLVKDIFPGSLNSLSNKPIFSTGKLLFFGANNGTNGIELWKSDGTENGTNMVLDINSGSDDSNPSSYSLFNNKVIFNATTSLHGNELWVMDLEDEPDLTPPSPSSFSPSTGSTITDIYQVFTFSLDEIGACRMSLSDESYDDMYNDANCTGDGSQSISCVIPGPKFGLNGNKNIYISCIDAYNNKDTISTNSVINYTLLETDPPQKSEFSPEPSSIISDSTQTITFETDENATCRLSLTDESYDQMVNDVVCEGVGSINQSCTSPDLGTFEDKTIYISCTDGNGNKDTATSNEELEYTFIPAGSIAGPILDFPEVDGSIYAMALNDDESILYIGGEFSQVGDISGGGTVYDRYNLAAIDTKTYEVLDWNLIPQGAVQTIEVYDNNVYIGGSFTDIYDYDLDEYVYTGEFAKINSDGTLDIDCMPEIYTDYGSTVYAIKATEEYIYVGGSFNAIGETWDISPLIRLNNNSSCTWDEDWAPYGFYDDNYNTATIYTIDTYGNDVYVGGNFTQIYDPYSDETANTGEFVKINSQGILDTTCSPKVRTYGQVGTVYSIKTTADYIYIGGSFDSIDDESVSNLARFENTASCTRDSEWMPYEFQDGNYEIGTIYSINFINDMFFIGGGFSRLYNFETDEYISTGEFIKLNSNGILDTEFDPQITTYEEEECECCEGCTVYSSVIGTKNIFVGGSFNMVGEEDVLGLTAFSMDSTPPTGNITINLGNTYSVSPNVTLSLSATDTSGVRQMMICNNSSFADCNWETYKTTKSWTFDSTYGNKTVYVKYMDNVGNISDVYSDSIILHTPSARITNIGEITDIPDKTPLTYYFTSTSVLIKGVSQSGSIIYFVYNGKTYTTVANGSGNFSITLTVSMGNNSIQYYSKDISNNQSLTKTLNLIVGTSYFPNWLLEKLGLITTIEQEETPNQLPQQEQIPDTPNNEPQEEEENNGNIQTLQFTDKDGNPLVNALVTIEGVEYFTDSKGEIQVVGLEKDKNYKVKIEHNGVKYTSEVLGASGVDGSIKVTISEGDISNGIEWKKILIYGGGGLLFIFFLILIFRRRKDKEEENKFQNTH